LAPPRKIKINLEPLVMATKNITPPTTNRIPRKKKHHLYYTPPNQTSKPQKEGEYMTNNILNHEDCLLSIEMDKKLETISFRVPGITKSKVEKLSAQQKKALNEALLVTTARAIHDAEFDPSKYLKE